MYELLGMCVGLAALLALNALASLLTAMLWRALSPLASHWSASTCARLVFTLRVLPAAVAIVGVAALLIPSYIAYEPHRTSESVSLKLALLSLLSAVGIALALRRGFASWRATRRLRADWLSEAEQVSIAGVSIPAYRIRHSFPVIAVVGTIRPRLFVASHVLDSLSEEELSAALAHETGHLAARDNLKRILLRACRDLLTLVPCGRSLDRVWAEAAEAAADEHAARVGAAVALNLAAALIEIARMVPAGARPTMPTGAFLLGDEADGVMGRVRRLVQLASLDQARLAHEPFKTRLFILTGRTCLCALFAALVLTATNAHVLSTMHAMMERVVQALS